MKAKYYLDTNLIVSYFYNRNKKQYEIAKELFISAKQNEIELVLLSEIIIEVEYSLKNHYGYERGQIYIELLSLVKSQYINMDHREAIIQAIKLYHQSTIDLVDCILFAKAKIDNADVASFDTDFKKLMKK